MTKRAIGLLLAMVSGCMSETGGTGGGTGGTTQPPRSSLVGNWINQSSLTTGNAYSFDAASNYVHSVFRLAPDGLSADGEIEDGTYDASVPGEIIFHAIKSTCAGALMLYHVNYAWDGTYLAISYSDALVTFSKNTSMGSTTTLRLGCFDRTTGIFTPGPLVTL